MIRNGLYLVISKLLDDAEGGATGVSVLRDGTMRGGGPIYYHVGSYVCSGGKWKGELTVREHTPAEITRVFARQVVSMGFSGTYTDDDAEFDATALVGKMFAIEYGMHNIKVIKNDNEVDIDIIERKLSALQAGIDNDEPQAMVTSTDKSNRIETERYDRLQHERRANIGM
jgi:hypothetical protein